MEYPVGERLRKLAAATLAGKLARAMHQVLYDATTRDVPLSISSGVVVKNVTLPTSLPVPDLQMPILAASEKGRIDTMKLLREVRDFLEFHSFREVIDSLEAIQTVKSQADSHQNA